MNLFLCGYQEFSTSISSEGGNFTTGCQSRTALEIFCHNFAHKAVVDQPFFHIVITHIVVELHGLICGSMSCQLLVTFLLWVITTVLNTMSSKHSPTKTETLPLVLLLLLPLIYCCVVDYYHHIGGINYTTVGVQFEIGALPPFFE